ncbi:hypothetical protein NDI54_14295 [Haloarcula sp. S1AR25-5A]|uniref:Uncharacterized protein n=1 Tax=Haloarcula terrestris TaxID=2950533 RepID=A0AAE4F1D0_9EURY|nr:hypothetical protein [Haloarcula terrestris]MDS0222511.1 hypothetical protein [Haloarcula terrestris]
MKLRPRPSGLLGTDGGDSTGMRYEWTLCGTRAEDAKAACPACGGQMNGSEVTGSDD